MTHPLLLSILPTRLVGGWARKGAPRWTTSPWPPYRAPRCVEPTRSSAHQDYLISVALPFHYADHPEKLWPVIYVLDANLYFGLVVDMVRAMNIRVDFCNELSDAFIVGVGYPVNGSIAEMLHQVMHLRLRDFVRSRDQGGEQFIQEHFPLATVVASGNAGPFLQFLQQELVPLIESDYQADPSDRSLLGRSWGADFAIYAMFQQPELFQRYVVASSSGNLVMEDQSDEDTANLHHFVSRLESRHYGGLTLTHQVIANSTHCAVVPPAFQAGLVAVLA